MALLVKKLVAEEERWAKWSYMSGTAAESGDDTADDRRCAAAKFQDMSGGAAGSGNEAPAE